ncbi:MAG: ThiF family adenylyltransferase, partial [Pirellulaceae bacterium]
MRFGKTNRFTPSGEGRRRESTSSRNSEPSDGGAFRWHAWPAQSESVSPAARGLLKGRAAGPFAADRLVVGGALGAVGGLVFEGLARAGVESILGVDPDVYGVDSWLTQPCGPSDVTREKAVVQGELAHAANPAVNVVTVQGVVQDLPLWLLAKAELIVLAGDNLEILAWGAGMGAALGKFVLQGAVHGESGSAIVRGCDLTNPASACPACAFSQRDWSAQTSRHGCDPDDLRTQGQEPTRTMPVICATAACLTLTEVLKRLAMMEGEAWGT